MKETLPIIPVEELEINGVYRNFKRDLVQVKRIDTIKRELYLFNISEQCNMLIRFERHTLNTKVR